MPQKAKEGKRLGPFERLQARKLKATNMKRTHVMREELGSEKRGEERGAVRRRTPGANELQITEVFEPHLRRFPNHSHNREQSGNNPHHSRSRLDVALVVAIMCLFPHTTGQLPSDFASHVTLPFLQLPRTVYRLGNRLKLTIVTARHLLVTA